MTKTLNGRKKPKVRPRIGYHPTRTAEEERFWNSYRPDYRTWALNQHLTIDEAAALAMGLDPRSIEYMTDQKNSTLLRFKATRRLLKRRLEEESFGPPFDLLGISIIGMGKDDLPLPPGLVRYADYLGEGLLDRDNLVARLERQKAGLEKKIASLNEKVAANVGAAPKVRRESDVTTSDKTNSKIILSLAAAHLGQKEADEQFKLIKNNRRSNIAKKVVTAVQLQGWKIEEETVLGRLRKALELWPANHDDDGLI